MALADVMKEVSFLINIWRFMLPAVGMPCISVSEDHEGTHCEARAEPQYQLQFRHTS